MNDRESYLLGIAQRRFEEKKPSGFLSWLHKFRLAGDESRELRDALERLRDRALEARVEEELR